MEFIGLDGKKKKLKRSASNYMIDWDANSRSKVQKRFKDFIKDQWYFDVVFEEFPLVGSRMTFDFYNASKNLKIEVDGMQHTQFSKFLHNGSKTNFRKQLFRDCQKEDYCELNGLTLLRFTEDEVNKEIEKVLRIVKESTE